MTRGDIIAILLILIMVSFAFGAIFGHAACKLHKCYICGEPSVCAIKAGEKEIQLCAECAGPHFQYLQQIEE